MSKPVALDPPTATSSINGARLREVVLARIVAATGRVLRPGEITDELALLVAPRLSSSQWRALVEQQIVALEASGLVTSAFKIKATDAGVAHAATYLGIKAKLLAGWNELYGIRLVAKMLGLEREPAKRLKELARPEGLRMAIVQAAYKLKIRGLVTPSRVRSALVSVALERAFGNKIKMDLFGAGLSAKAGRLLAAQLAKRPRNFGTDGRLIAALAAEHLNVAQSDLDTLRLALLRRFLSAGAVPEPGKHRPGRASVSRSGHPPPAAPGAYTGRPDLQGFAQEVRQQAAGQAQGWAGNRRAYISHVWRNIRERRPDWGLSEIEFKCMLAEAHRAGQLALANADLKDSASLQDLKDSALSYKNAVFHFIRVEG